MSRFLEALRSGRVLLMDGAMGTELQRAGIEEGECYEAWNLTHPEQVRAIHRGYVFAGARGTAPRCRKWRRRAGGGTVRGRVPIIAKRSDYRVAK